MGTEIANNFFVWDVNPELVRFGALTIRWYGVLFACAFLFGFQLITWIYKREGKPEKDLDSLFIYMVLGTVIGARLGHCFFYQPLDYLKDPLEIFKVWHGGLASHGAVVGILTALYIYSKKHVGQPFLWLVSRITIVVALAAVFIRIGNFFNSEIVGMPTDLPWAVIFPRQYYGEIVPRHPAQLYEAFAYLCIFIFLLITYVKHGKNTEPTLLIGWFFFLIFTARFFIEFIKAPQVEFEQSMALDMGQILSIPLVIFGLYMLWYAKKKKKSK